MKIPQTILLPKQLQPEILAFLDSYIFQTDISNLLFSLSFEVEGYFVALELLNIDKCKEQKAHKVRLPVQLVLSTAVATEKEIAQIGFLP